MGEQGHISPPNHIVTVIMRNSRGKFFVYFAVLSILCFIVFLLSSTHTSLKELESVNEKCQQQRDSLSAQLQVVYEHKNRLEMSLQQEKSDHRHTKEVYKKQVPELENKIQQEREKRLSVEKQISQIKNSYSELEEDKLQSETALKEQLQTMQNQKNLEMEKQQTQISDLLAEKDKLELTKNAFAWKIEQHASEVSLCHLQQEQLKTELAGCQEQVQKHLDSNINVAPSKVDNVNVVPSKVDKVAEMKKSPEQEVAENKVEEHKEVKENATQIVIPKDKVNMLERPHIVQPANDGVLVKPIEEKPDIANKVIEEVNPKDTGAENRVNFDAEENKNQKLFLQNNEIVDKRDLENHPQVQPPNNFDNLEKDDHAAEKGEYNFNQNIPFVRQQLEQPAFKNFHNGANNKRSNFYHNPDQANDAAAQMQDMMNKSPGNVLHAEDPLHDPPHGFGAIDNKINAFRNSDAFLNRGGERHAVDDKNYEEDDDDRDNDDEPVNAAGPALKAANVLPDNDFDDQENQENADNAKEEEGVVIAPK